MTDDPKKERRIGSDPGAEEHEIHYLARKMGISADEVRRLIDRPANDGNLRGDAVKDI
jgi:hypothetical protein